MRAAQRGKQLCQGTGRNSKVQKQAIGPRNKAKGPKTLGHKDKERLERLTQRTKTNWQIMRGKASRGQVKLIRGIRKGGKSTMTERQNMTHGEKTKKIFLAKPQTMPTYNTQEWYLSHLTHCMKVKTYFSKC